jgi:hypothetical protein
MCYNKDISLYTYFIGLVASFLLIQKKDKDLKIVGCFFLFVIHMQLIEYFLWTNNKCNLRNITLSYIGTIVNFIQPIILYLAIFYYNKELYKKNKQILDSIIIIYIIGLIIYSITLFPIGCTSVTPISSPYLQWSWFYKKNPELLTLCFPIILMILMYYGLNKPYNLYISLICIISFIVSYIIYNKQRAFGSLWCWFAVFIPMGVLLIDTFKNL